MTTFPLRHATHVLLVDDHVLLAQSLASALGREGFTTDVLDGSDPGDVVARTAAFHPAVVLLDLMLDGADWRTTVDLIPRVNAVSSARVLVLTGVTERVLHAECVKAGAVGVASKSRPFHEIVEQLRNVARGEAALADHEREELFAERRRGRAAEARRRAPFDALTRREQEILAALMDGTSPHEIAIDSYVSAGTVRSQLKTIFRKLEVGSQIAAVAKAYRAGWSLHPDPPAR